MTVLVLVTLLALCSLALTAQPAAAQEQQGNATLPVSYPPTVLEGDSESCASIEEREMARTQISKDIRGSLRDVVTPAPCGGLGWTLAASLNMTDPTQNCPSGWYEDTRSGKRLCFRQTSDSGGCDSVIFSTDRKEYTHVCGRAIGYQYASGDAFFYAPGTIDNHYVDGLSVTHGQPGDRTHIWTFAVGLDEVLINTDSLCPCVSPANIALVPSYVAANYFCETGVPYPNGWSHGVFYPDDPLWDGDGCGPNSDCCSFNSPPWFTVELPTPTTDDIEVRNCADFSTNDEDTGIELIEFYIL